MNHNSFLVQIYYYWVGKKISFIHYGGPQFHISTKPPEFPITPRHGSSFMAVYCALGARAEAQSQPTCLCGSVHSQPYLHRTLVLLTWGLASALKLCFLLFFLHTQIQRGAPSLSICPTSASSRALGSLNKSRKRSEPQFHYLWIT